MDSEFSAMCIPLISMSLCCIECTGCTNTFMESRVDYIIHQGLDYRGNFISILSVECNSDISI